MFRRVEKRYTALVRDAQSGEYQKSSMFDIHFRESENAIFEIENFKIAPCGEKYMVVFTDYSMAEAKMSIKDYYRGSGTRVIAVAEYEE